jgi:hypothetical protein
MFTKCSQFILLSHILVCLAFVMITESLLRDTLAAPRPDLAGYRFCVVFAARILGAVCFSATLTTETRFR